MTVKNTQGSMVQEIRDRSYKPKGESECLCPSCHRVFASVEAFDMHLIGRHGVDRTCLKTALPEFGLELDSVGRWRRRRH